ncbi:MAG: thioredoxin family protein [Pseudorhodoplanes sp.]
MHQKIVSRDEWLKARKEHLVAEKALTKARDALCRQRRELPWVKVNKHYVFDTPQGTKTLAELFEGRSQLIVKHFMLAPGQKDGCVGCSFEVDHVEGALQHIEQHDVKFVSVARAPLAEIEAFKDRMGWRFDWVSSYGSDFNYDFNVSFTPEQVATGAAIYNFEETAVPLEDLSGFSVFYKNEAGDIFHTYSSFGRGGEEVLGSYMLLDMTPKGRNEPGPNYNLTDWVRHHDRYESDGHVRSNGRWVAGEKADCCH